MEHFKYELNLDYDKLNLGSGHRAYMQCYIPSNYDFSEGRTRPAIIICPGGGYGHLSTREAEPVALQYLAADIAAFVLYYSVDEDAGFPRCLFEALTAVKTVRENAQKWNINPDKIAISGFSAGGHLAATASAYWDSELASVLGDKEAIKINATILSYAVISSKEKKNIRCFENLFGENPSEKELLSTSIEDHVTESFPPTFIWHTATDQIAPAQHSLLMGQSLYAANVPFELHIYPQGPHGMALCDIRSAKDTQTKLCVELPRRWVADSIRFLKEIAFNK